MSELFNEELKFTTGHKDKLAIFDGNILVGSQTNRSENNTKTMVTFRRVSRPDDKSIGDFEDESDYDLNHVDGYAFHFNKVESVDVVIKALEEVKESMNLAR